MTSQAFEILCPACHSVVPLDAVGCPTCERTELRDAAYPAAAPVEPTSPTTPAPDSPPDLQALPMRDYHRVVRATYQATEPTATGGSRLRAYLPFAVLVLLLIVGAAMLYGHV
jgi:hypothetical protein